MFRAVVKQDAQGEYVQHDTHRHAITWAIPTKDAPAPGYPVQALRSPGYNYDYSKRLMLYRYPDGREFLGHADWWPGAAR